MLDLSPAQMEKVKELLLGSVDDEILMAVSALMDHPWGSVKGETTPEKFGFLLQRFQTRGEIQKFLTLLASVNPSAHNEVEGIIDWALPQPRSSALILTQECIPSFAPTIKVWGNESFQRAFRGQYISGVTGASRFKPLSEISANALKYEPFLIAEVFPKVDAVFIFIDNPTAPADMRALVKALFNMLSKRTDAEIAAKKVVIVVRNERSEARMLAEHDLWKALISRTQHVCKFVAENADGSPAVQEKDPLLRLNDFLNGIVDPPAPPSVTDMAILVGAASEESADFQRLADNLACSDTVAIVPQGRLDAATGVAVASTVVKALESSANPWIIQHVGSKFQERPGALVRFLNSQAFAGRGEKLEGLLQRIPNPETLWAPPTTEGDFPAEWGIEEKRRCRESPDEFTTTILSRLGSPYIGLDRPTTIHTSPVAMDLHRYNRALMAELAVFAGISAPLVSEISLQDRDPKERFKDVADAILPGELNIFGSGIFNVAGSREISRAIKPITDGIHSALEIKYSNPDQLKRAKESIFFVSFIPCPVTPGGQLRVPPDVGAADSWSFDRGPEWWIITVGKQATGKVIGPDKTRLERVMKGVKIKRSAISEKQKRAEL